MNKNIRNAFLALVVLMLSTVACFGGGPALPLRSDMPTQGLETVAQYTLKGPANNPDQQKNEMVIQGVNEFSPIEWQNTVFSRVSGLKTQQVKIHNTPVLGMTKVERKFGYTGFSSVETATYHGRDANGSNVCGIKVRLQFNRNLTQYFTDRNDYDSLWYYDVPCEVLDSGEVRLVTDQAKLRALVVNEVWQARIAHGSFFFNWGHSVTVVGGLPAQMAPRWWENGDIPNTTNDSIGAANLLNDLVNDLKASHAPWVEFKADGKFAGSGAHLIYSAGDADQYATWNRVLLNRQNEYVVLYRPNQNTPWDFMTVKPVYDYEWNNAGRVWANLKGWGANPFEGRLNEQGLPKSADDGVIAEIQRIGWMNAPNASLNQLQFVDSDGVVRKTITIRAFVGAKDSLIIYGAQPPSFSSLQTQVPGGENPPMPVLRNEKGKVLTEQPWTPENWASFVREGTIWNFLKDNPSSVNADLFIQYRFNDNTTWAPIPCSDGGTCGYRPIDWNLTASYFFDGNTRQPFMLNNLLGEVGVRTLGFSYASGRYEGTGMLFALANREFYDRYYAGFNQEDIFMLDARAMQLPEHLAEGWIYANE